jgi:hypothetical protein
MRTIFLLPLTAVVTVVVGCGPEGSEQAALSLPQRDLTLPTQTAEVEIASPVELQNLRVQHRTARPSRRTSRRSIPEAKPTPAAPATALVVAASYPVAQPANTASEPANDRELLPGKTVTVIPVSTGPSTGSDWSDDFPRAKGGTMVVRGGGRCPPRGRGPGIGIAAAPRPDFR